MKILRCLAQIFRREANQCRQDTPRVIRTIFARAFPENSTPNRFCRVLQRPPRIRFRERADDREVKEPFRVGL